MNNLNDIRILVREIISEKFKSSISKGYFQDVDLGDGIPSEGGSFNKNDKSIKSINPFKGNVKSLIEFDNLLKKITLKIKEKNSNIIEEEGFKNMNEKYKKLFEFFKDNGKIPGELDRFYESVIKPFFKKNENLIRIPEVKDFYGIK
jgi:effector-binding domain-containing protein